jgi:Lipid A 3-O-deacylase (PagL)
MASVRFAVFNVILLFTCIAYAQEQPPSSAPLGAWDIAIWAAGASGEENTNSWAEAQVWTGGLFLGRTMDHEVAGGWRRGIPEYGINLIPLFVTSRNQSVHGGGFEPIILRWNSAYNLRGARPYIDLAGGAVFTNANLPPGRTSSVNFTARAGAGFQLLHRNQHAVDLACHWAHISNANLGFRNSEFNGIQVSVAYHWFR